MSWREFRFVRKGKATLLWRIKQNQDSYATEHGQLDGKLQLHSDTPGPKGKEGTKAYVDPIANCKFHVNREIRKKTEAGYIEYVDGLPTEEQVTSLDFDNFVPKAFTGYKPQTSISDSAHAKLAKLGTARYTRKYDGMAHVAVHHSWGWEIYTRRMDVASDRFPHHIKKLEWESSFDVGTVIIGEMVCFRDDRKDDFKAISRICRSDPPEARKLIHDGEVPEPTFVIFDVLYHNGAPLNDNSYDERSELWKWNFVPAARGEANDFVCSVDYFNLTPDTWEKYAKENQWEGFVIVDGRASPGDKFFSFDGKAKRPKGSHKLKPIYEDDVVIYAGLKGTGKRLGGIGSVFVKQIHPETGEWFDCGKVGSGFTDEGLEEIEALIKKHGLPVVNKNKEVDELDLSDGSGIVAMIEYSDRQPGTNKFRFPIFKRVRFDKGVDECEAQKLAEEEE